MKVLIANKDREFLDLFQRMIAHFFPEAKFAFAKNHQSAVNLIKKVGFDVVLTELFFTSAMYWAQYGVSISDTTPEGISVIRAAKESGVPAVIATSILCGPEESFGKSEIALGTLAYQNGAHCVLSAENIFPDKRPYFLGEIIRAFFLKGKGGVHGNYQKSV